MPLKPFPLTKIGINCVLKATLMHYSENPLFWRAFWRPSWISALGPLFIFGNIVNVFWGHIRNLKKLVWFSPGGVQRDPPLAPRLHCVVYLLKSTFKNAAERKILIFSLLSWSCRWNLACGHFTSIRFWWYRNLNFFWKKCGDDVEVVQCLFKNLKFGIVFN